MHYFLKKIAVTFLLILIVSESTNAQTYSEAFWNNPNVIWKTSSGTIISGAFAKKMHLQGDYSLSERELRGGKKEIKMIPPGEEKHKRKVDLVDWNDPNLVIKDDAGQLLPKGMSQLLLRMKTIDWKIDTLPDGSIQVIFNIGASQNWKSSWAESNVAYIKDWVDSWKGKQLPDFSLRDVNGNLTNSRYLRGDFLVLNFWNTNCAPCAKQMEELNKITEVFKDQDVVFLAPTYELTGTVDWFLRSNEFNYQVLVDAQSLIADLNLNYYPVHMIVDRKGTILDINVGGTYNIGEEVVKRLSWLVTDKSSN